MVWSGLIGAELVRGFNNVVQVTELANKIELASWLNSGVFGMNRAILSNLGSIHGRRTGAKSEMRSARQQRGMTTLGLIILVGFLGLFVFAFMRLSPIYLNYMKVAGVINGVHEEFDGQNPSRNAMRTSIARRFGVESVDVITHRDVEIIGVDGGFDVIAEYDHTAPFISNIYFTVKFDKRTTVRR